MDSTSAIKRRNKDKIFIVGYPAHQITCCKLPSNRQVLATLFYNLRSVKLSLRNSAKITIQEILVFWGKARIPIKHEKDAITKLEKLYAEWRNLQKDQKKQSEAASNKIKEFALKIDDIFDIAHQDALAMMKSEEDKQFLLKQREKGRPGSMLRVDLKLARAEERKLQKELAKKNKQIRSGCFNIDVDSDSEEDEDSDGAENICDVYDGDDMDVSSMDICTSKEAEELPGPSHSKKIRRGTREILTMKLSLLLDRCKVSDRNATRILIANIEALGENPDDFKVSKTVIQERRKVFREKYTENVKEQVHVTEKDAVVVHWDGKLLPSILKTEQTEQIAVLISYGEHERLLGVPTADNSTGEEQALAVYNCIEEWGISHTIKAMCFDTTSSNTGRLKGACIILEQILGRELLYLACRHHILEIVLRGVFECKFGSSTAPGPDLFKRFKSAWSKLNKKQYDTLISNENVRKHILPEVIANITVDFKTKLTESQPRDDYKELLQLVLVFVGSLDGNEVGFRAPGAISHARWMAKAIYCLKIFLFRGQFKLSDKENSAVEAVCVFLVRVYCKAWFNAPIAYLAPKQDFNLLRSLLDYQVIDKDISERALLKFSNHLWYFNAELVALVFFDPTISDEEKSKMANKVLTHTVQKLDRTETESENSRILNPKFLGHQLKEMINAGLSDLITNETMHFFQRFQINPDFLKEHPSSWSKNNNFKEGLEIVKSLKVVNDIAERGVKLITDFNDLLTKDEEQKQYILQVVSQCRNLYPDCSKRTLRKPVE